jgi:TP901 family phage tail tape measure protein
MARSGQASVEVLADFSRFAETFQRDLNTALRGVRIDMTGVSNQISNGVRDGVNASNEEFRRLGNQAGESFATISRQSQQASRTMAASFATAGREMSSVGDQMTMAISLPVAAAGVATINAAGDFEKAMNKVRAATESSGQEFTNLRNLAIDLGSTTAFSAAEAAYAMNELATAGFDTAEIMGALPGVLDMAAAGSVSLSEAADIASGILNGFGFAATDLSYVNDILARDFLSTATTLSDLGESFKYVGPTAKSAGLTFTEVAAAIGLMGNAGIKGSMAGTALNSSISRLLKPTKEVKDVLKALGVTVTNSSGKLLPLVDIMRKLEKSGADTADMIALFGLEAGPDMMALLSQGSGALANLDRELQNAGGTAQKVATTQMAGFNGSMDELSSSAEGLMIAIGDAGLLGWVTSLTDKLTELTMKASKLSPALLKITTIVAIVAAAIGPFLAVFGRMATAIGEGILALKKFGSWALRVVPWLSALSGPVGWVIAGIIALGIAAVVAYKKCEVFRSVVDRAFRAVATAAVWMWQNAIVPAFTWIVAEAKVVGSALVGLWQQARPVFVAWGAAVMRIWNSAIRPAFGAIGDSFATAGSAIAGFWVGTAQPALTALMGLFARLAVAIRSWWMGNGDNVMRMAASVVTRLGGVMVQVWTGIMAVLKAAAAVIAWAIVNVTIPMWKALIAVTKTAIGVIVAMRPVWIVLGAVIVAAVIVVVAIVKILWAVVSTSFSAMATIIRWLWTSVVVPAFTGIGVAIQAAAAVIQWLWTSIIGPAFRGLGTVFAAFGSVAIWLWQSVVVPAFRAMGAVVTWLWGVISPVFGAMAAVIGVVGAVVSWLWATFGPVIIAIGNLLWTVWSGMISVVFELLKLAFFAVMGVLALFWANVKFIFGALAAVVMAAWSTVLLPILTAIGSLFTWLWGVISPVVTAIGALFTWLWGATQSAFTAISSIVKGEIAKVALAAAGVALFVNNLSGYFQSAVSAVREKISAVTGIVRALPGQIVDAIGGLGSLLYGAGQNVINGLIDGIGSRIGALRDRIASAAATIRNALPFSPAKEGPLSGQGDPTIAGGKIVSMIASGIGEKIPSLRDAAWSMADSAYLAMQTSRAGRMALSAEQTPSLLTRRQGTTATATTVEPQRVYNLTVQALDPRSASSAVIAAISQWERDNGTTWRK